MYCIWFNAEAILLGLKQDPEVARLASLYLKWVSLGLPGMSILLLFPEEIFLNNLFFVAYTFNLISRYDPRYDKILAFLNELQAILPVTRSVGLIVIGRRNSSRLASKGLFAVPTRIICIVAPINAFLNYVLGIFSNIPFLSFNPPDDAIVWGPEPIRLGYIGAPIATACAFNLVCLMNIVYGVFIAPRTAWQPISRRSFTSLGVLVNLGLAGVGACTR